MFTKQKLFLIIFFAFFSFSIFRSKDLEAKKTPIKKDEVEILLLDALKLYKGRKYSLAIKSIDLAKRKIEVDSFFWEGVLLDIKNNRAARKKYEKCIKINPNHIKAMFNLAYIYGKTGGRKGPRKALNLLKKIEKIDYYYERLHYRIATIYCELRKWDEAIKEFNIALEQRKKDYDIYYNLGRIYYHFKKDYEKAEYYFKQAKTYKAPFKDIEKYLKNIKKLKRK